MTVRQTLILFLCSFSLLLAVSLSACQKAGPQIAAGPSATPPPVKSPTETLKDLLAASEKGDGAAVTAMLCRDSLASFEKSARESQTTVAELARKGQVLPVEGATANLETRQEQITGDAASVEARAPKMRGVSSDNGEWVTFYFLREDGAWKFDGNSTLQALADKFREKLQKTAGQIKQAQEDLKQQKERLNRLGDDIRDTNERIKRTEQQLDPK